VSSSAEQRLRDALGGGPLSARLATAAAGFLERRSGDAALGSLEGRSLVGLARLLASQPEVAGFLSHRPALLERIARADSDRLSARIRELEQWTPEGGATDLEGALDALRVLRREETCWVACLDLGGSIPFEEAARFLSILAETIAQQALALAEAAVGVSDAARELAVIGMGKIAGREFTYHSDLDLVFLHGGDADALQEVLRVGQRLIAYLTTMTGAGVAYAVDTRLRPSGQQGVLVTSFDAFTRYQTQQARRWEHVALLRARAVGGAIASGQQVLDDVRTRILAARESPWSELADLRKRVESERAGDSDEMLPLKTGAGGLMDVDFLASGGLLERGAARFPTLPSVPALLRTTLAGPRVDTLLDDYAFLRLVEARSRWCAGRALEGLRSAPDALEPVAELIEPGSNGAALLERVARARRRIREAYDAVIRSGSIGALEG
jgi:glutamate-ammonia-ligase adenylyltransferase